MNRARGASNSADSPPKSGMVRPSVRRDAHSARRVLTLTAALALALQPIQLGRVAATNDAAHYLGTVKTAPASAPADPRAYVRDRASRGGWAGNEWRCLDVLIRLESGWRVDADNPHSSAQGLFQMLRQKPGLSLARQTTIGLRYIRHRHDTPCQALSFHRAHGWY